MTRPTTDALTPTTIAAAVCLFLFMHTAGCMPLASSALTAKDLRANEDEIKYIQSHDLEPYIQTSIIHNQVVRGMVRRDVRFLKGEPRDSTVKDGVTTWSYGSVTRNQRFMFSGGVVVDKG